MSTLTKTATVGRWWVLAVAAFLLCHVTTSSAAAESKRRPCTGLWSAHGSPAYKSSDNHSGSVKSPDGRFSIHASSRGLSLKAGRAGEELLEVLVNPPLTEVLWAPDSHRFAINSSDGGLIGSWQGKYFDTMAGVGQPAGHDLSGIVQEATASFARCDDKEIVNFGIATWIHGSNELLVVVQVPPHSSCKNMGEILGLIVTSKAPRVTGRLSGAEVRRKWNGALGCLLRGE